MVEQSNRISEGKSSEMMLHELCQSDQVSAAFQNVLSGLELC
jgi:hypothetical protein